MSLRIRLVKCLYIHTMSHYAAIKSRAAVCIHAKDFQDILNEESKVQVIRTAHNHLRTHTCRHTNMYTSVCVFYIAGRQPVTVAATGLGSGETESSFSL